MSAVINSPHARDVASILHPMTNPGKHEKDGPLILDEGNGVYVKDLEGNEYIEGMAGLWCTSLGFSNERLIDAAVAQMRKLPTYTPFSTARTCRLSTWRKSCCRWRPCRCRKFGLPTRVPKQTTT